MNEDDYERNQICDELGKAIIKVCEDPFRIEQSNMIVEYGGCLRAIIDGKPQNIADYMNKKEQEKSISENYKIPKNGEKLQDSQNNLELDKKG